MLNYTVTDARHGPGLTVDERLYLNSKGEVVGADAEDRVTLVAAAGAPIAAEFHDRVKAYVEAAESRSKAAPKAEPAAAEGEAEETPAPAPSRGVANRGR